VADAFFPVASDGMRHNARADVEIPKALARIEKARANGKRGGRPPKAEKEPSENPAGFDPVNRNETQPLTEQLFFTWLKKLPIEKLINTKGTTYKNLTEEDKNLLLNNQTAFTVINKSNSVLKRPIIEKSNLLLVGFDEKEWSELV
jgi:arsenate reductase-like glutaredoxin family protein